MAALAAWRVDGWVFVFFFFYFVLSVSGYDAMDSVWDGESMEINNGLVLIVYGVDE